MALRGSEEKKGSDEKMKGATVNERQRGETIIEKLRENQFSPMKNVNWTFFCGKMGAN